MRLSPRNQGTPAKKSPSTRLRSERSYSPADAALASAVKPSPIKALSGILTDGAKRSG
jgi:hypothetical protein